MPTARRHCFLWDVLVSPSKLKRTNRNFQHDHQVQAGRIFWDTGKFIPYENLLTKVISTFIQLFSFRNACCDRELCITKAAAIVMWHNNCSLLPVARTSKVSSCDRQPRDLKRNVVFCLLKKVEKLWTQYQQQTQQVTSKWII